MHIPSRLGSALGGVAALSMLAVCSVPVGGTSLPLTRNGALRQPIIRRHVGRVVPLTLHRTAHIARFARLVHPMSRLPLGPFDFVSDFGNNEVYILNTSGSVYGTLTASSGLQDPQGMSVTNSPARLYVANSGDDDILVYSSSTLNSPAVLSDPGQEPGDVSVDSSGNVAAENYDGSISCYTAGATSPSFTISGSTASDPFYYIYFGAFDLAGNLYIDGFDYDGYAIVGEVAGGCSSPNNTVTNLTTSNNILYSGGVQVASNGFVSIEDQQALAIYTYRPPTNGSLGNPVATTPLTGASDPVSFSFTSGSNQALTADDGLTDANLYSFPAGGPPAKTFVLPGAVDPIGTAAFPSEQF